MWPGELSALRTRMARNRHDTIVRRFRAACETGDARELTALLHPDVALVVDGSLEDVALGPVLSFIERAVNGSTGLVVRRGERVVAVIAFEIRWHRSRSRRIRRLWVVSDPAKLRGWNPS